MMKKILFCLVCGIVLCFGAGTGSNVLESQITIIKGEALPFVFESRYLTNLELNGKKVRGFPHPKDDSKIVYLLTSPYKQPLTKATLKADYANGASLIYHILGSEGDYQKEQLKVDNAKIAPPKEVTERIQRELNEANKVYSIYTDEKLFDGTFAKPIDSAITSAFGNARIFNDTLASYHGGTDFRAVSGTPIYATNDGIVRIAKDRYYAGKSVVIDHGYKIFSQYYHLSEIKVKPGEKVKKGQLIGLSGASGRVTGAHLHFGILIAGVQVNPLVFIERLNALFE